MTMTLEFSCKTTVLFKIFTASDCITLIVFLVVAFLLSLCFELFLSLRQRLFEKYKSESVSTLSLKRKLILTLFYTVVAILSILHMFFLMSCNFYIVICLIFGNVIGYLVFGTNLKRKESFDYSLTK